ncbi:MAG: thioredoxin [Verrucomicrobiae bacterium]|nr:thioredoxin [Verrucomicrobiae bacterium]
MASDHVLHLNGGNFESEVSGETPVLVDFWAEWCGPCKMIAPLLDEIANESVGKFKIAKVEVDQNQDLAGRYNIRAIPTMLIFKNGQVKEQMVGVVSKKEILGKLTSAAA